MQNDYQLTVDAMRRRLRSCYPDQEVVTLEGDGPVHASYAQVAERVDRLARALERLGVQPGDRVGTFAWNTQQHLEALPRGAVHGRGAAHAQHPPVPRAARLHRQPRRGPRHLRRRLARRRCSSQARAAARDASSSSSSWATATRGALPERARATRSCSPRRATRLRLARARRARGRGALLHERHDRQPQGRRVLAPLDRAARDRRSAWPTPIGLSPRRPRARRSCRCSTPTPGACRTRAALTGADLRHARPLPAGRAARAADRGRAGDARRRRADGLDRPAALRRRARRRPVSRCGMRRSAAARPCRGR